MKLQVSLFVKTVQVVSISDGWFKEGRGVLSFSHTLATFCVASPVNKISFELT